MSIEPTFGEWLEDQMLSIGYTQTDLAEELGISQSTVSNWVNGVSPPTRKNCYRLADIFGVPRRDVVLRAGHRPKDADLVPVTATSRNRVGPGFQTNGTVREIADSLRDPRVRLFLQRAGELTDEQWDELLRILDGEE